MREVDRKLDTLQTIELAEGMEIRLRIAGPLLRVLAWLLDFFFLVAAIVVISIVTVISGIVIGGNVVRGLLMLAWFVLSWWYPVFFEASKWGATFGKNLRLAGNAAFWSSDFFLSSGGAKFLTRGGYQSSVFWLDWYGELSDHSSIPTPR